MTDNVKFLDKHSQKQTRSFWAKRLGNLQAHKWIEKRMKNKTKKKLTREMTNLIQSFVTDHKDSRYNFQ
jgi:hypothetical protein